MIYNFLSVYGIYYPPVTIETRVKWRIYTTYIHLYIIECCVGIPEELPVQFKFPPVEYIAQELPTVAHRSRQLSF